MAIWISQAFNALSLGSILLLIAIGLTFSFGLMNVINMAHGELIMSGAYVAYVVQRQIISLVGPSGVDYYLVIALPVLAIRHGMGLQPGIYNHGRRCAIAIRRGLSVFILQCSRGPTPARARCGARRLAILARAAGAAPRPSRGWPGDRRRRSAPGARVHT